MHLTYNKVNIGVCVVVPAIISSLQSVHQTIPRAVLIAQLNMVCCFVITKICILERVVRRCNSSIALVPCRKRVRLRWTTALHATSGHALMARLQAHVCIWFDSCIRR